MAFRQILRYGDSRLREKSFDVTSLDQEALEIIQDLIDTLELSRGVGLAAPQLGFMKQIILIDPRPMKPELSRMIMINPKITNSSGKSVFEEGCLSLPGIFTEIKRPDLIEIEYTDPDGKILKNTFTGLYARIMQHEVDHLKGILFIDYMSKIKRWYFSSKLNKLKYEN